MRISKIPHESQNFGGFLFSEINIFLILSLITFTLWTSLLVNLIILSGISMSLRRLIFSNILLHLDVLHFSRKPSLCGNVYALWCSLNLIFLVFRMSIFRCLYLWVFSRKRKIMSRDSLLSLRSWRSVEVKSSKSHLRYAPLLRCFFVIFSKINSSRIEIFHFFIING